MSTKRRHKGIESIVFEVSCPLRYRKQVEGILLHSIDPTKQTLLLVSLDTFLFIKVIEVVISEFVCLAGLWM